MNKFIYIFRIHNEEELIKITEVIQRRRFAISYLLDEWIECSALYDLDDFRKSHPKEKDLMIRVYFNNERNQRKFKKEIRGLLGQYCCGNFNCNQYGECEYSTVDGPVEYIWRCIRRDENRLSARED